MCLFSQFWQRENELIIELSIYCRYLKVWVHDINFLNPTLWLVGKWKRTKRLFPGVPKKILDNADFVTSALNCESQTVKSWMLIFLSISWEVSSTLKGADIGWLVTGYSSCLPSRNSVTCNWNKSLGNKIVQF